MQESTRAYLTTALWSSLDDHDEPLDGQYDISDISERTVRQSAIDIQAFLLLCENQGIAWEEDIDDLYRLLHDFWLTRNHHGAGFWGGDYPIWGEKLTAIAHMFAEADLYVGDDGKIYHV